MKFNTLLSAALFAGSVYADESSSSTTTESSTAAVAPPMPTFKASKLKGDFIEQFNEGWDKRWKPSHAKKDMKGSDSEEEWAYVGEWAVEEPTVYKGMDGNPGLVVKNAAAHHAISAKFPKKIDNKGKTLVVQYEVKLQNGLECGGAYLKLLRENKALHQEEFANTTPYVIMFGPDKCGHTNKVHVIINHKNPKTGEYEEKHLSSPPTARIVKTTELYTLIVHPNNTYVIKQNGEQVKEGSLLEDFTPSINPPKEIDDPKDTKPEDWVDEARIPDPEATKPADWDEDAPFEVLDDEATKPEDWLDAEPLSIPDPEATKPEDWDDEEDGDWIAPTIPNPKCADVSGCGPWSKPMKQNPDYKGKWTAPYIDNPAYKGVWAPRKIKNPDYYEDKTPANLEPMGAIGFEIWTMQNDIMFNNIYIGHSVEDADKLAEETFKEKHPVEQWYELQDKPKEPEKPKSPDDLKFMDDPVHFMKEKWELFLAVAKNDPLEAIKYVPEISGSIGAIVITVLAVLAGIIGRAGAPVPAEVKKNVKDAAKSVKETAAAAVATGSEAIKSGSETVKSEVNKRTTRSNQ